MPSADPTAGDPTAGDATAGDPTAGVLIPGGPATDDTVADAVVNLAAAAPRTRVVLDRRLDPFERLTPDQRRRLLVRVLCELVAYDEEPAPDALDHRLAG